MDRATARSVRCDGAGRPLQYWTVAELNTAIPGIGGTLLWNRILWLGLGVFALGLSVITYPRSRRVPDASAGCRRSRFAGRGGDQSAGAGDPPSIEPPSILAAFRPRPVPAPGPARGHDRPPKPPVSRHARLGARRPPPGSELRREPVRDARLSAHLPDARGAARHLYSVILLLVVVLYSGELIWKERSLEVEEILDSMPTPSGVYFGAKLVALLLVIAIFLLVGRPGAGRLPALARLHGSRARPICTGRRSPLSIRP